jgi:hypothetical protein
VRVQKPPPFMSVENVQQNRLVNDPLNFPPDERPDLVD